MFDNMGACLTNVGRPSRPSVRPPPAPRPSVWSLWKSGNPDFGSREIQMVGSQEIQNFGSRGIKNFGSRVMHNSDVEQSRHFEVGTSICFGWRGGLTDPQKQIHVA